MITFTDKSEDDRVKGGFCRGCYGCQKPCGRKKGSKTRKVCKHASIIEISIWTYCIKCNKTVDKRERK